MPKEQSHAALSEKQYTTLVIRLLIDRDGEVEGTVVDLEETTVGRFQQLESLPALIQEWLDQISQNKSS
ncbi:MAG: hypothetical protein AAF629_34750 [Chloroflexota bacterium]